MTHNEIGDFGEQYIARLLAEAGEVTPGGPADLLFEGVSVEVKTARPSNYNGRNLGYQFCLRKRGHTDHRKAAVLILLCLGLRGQVRGVFVIPTEVIGERRKLTMPLNLSSKWAHWQGRFEVLANYV